MKEEAKDKNLTPEEEKKLGVGAFFTFKPELYGFYFGFIIMIIVPLISFFVTKSVCASLNYSKSKQDMYGMISSVIFIWIIMVSYAIYYCKSDFVAVFGTPSKEEGKIKKD